MVPQPPRERQRGQPETGADGGQCIEIGVRRSVVGLPLVTEHPGDRGEHHERRQIEPGGQLMQIQRGFGLRTQHRVHGPLGQPLDRAVLQHPGRVHDGTQWMPRRLHIGDDPGQRLTITHITGPYADDGTLGGQLLDKVGHFCGSRPRPAEQQQLPYAVREDEVTGHEGAQGPGATGDQHRAIRVEAGGRHAFRAVPVEPRHEQRVVAQRELWLTGGQYEPG